jgi:hypothetical protein
MDLDTDTELPTADERRRAALGIIRAWEKATAYLADDEDADELNRRYSELISPAISTLDPQDAGGWLPERAVREAAAYTIAGQWALLCEQHVMDGADEELLDEYDSWIREGLALLVR